MPTFITQLLFIRLKQGFRALREVGWLLIIALPMAGILLFVIWDKLAGLRGWELGLLTGIIFLAIHWQRKDLDFLSKCGHSPALIILVEYQISALLISVPVLFLNGDPAGLFFTHLAMALIAFVPLPRRSGERKVIRLSWLPPDKLEWKSGIRRQWRILLPVYLAGILLSGYIAGTLLSVAVILMIVLSFYDELESRPLLENALRSHFLWRKWWDHYRWFGLLLLPQILLYLIFHPAYWYFMAYLLLVAGIFLGCAIFYKYSTYLPNRHRANNQTPMAILFMSLIVPFFSPLSLIAFFVLHHRARKRLQHFFPNA